MYFEFDSNKSQSNLRKHGINFLDAQFIWDDPRYIEVPAKSEDELRFAAIGQIWTKVWVAFFTLRNGKIRLMSVRRARDEEVEIYEGA